jgi:hypothetical protein
MWREWLLRGGRLRIAVIVGLFSGLFFGIGMGIFFYWAGSRSVVGAIAVGVVAGAAFGTLMVVRPWPGAWWGVKPLFELPPSDRVLVLGAVMRGEPVSNPRLAPGVLAYAKVVMASARKLQARPRRWVAFALAALELVIAVVKTITGPAWQAVFFWAATAMFLGIAWATPWALERQRMKAEAAADSAADQIGESP